MKNTSKNVSHWEFNEAGDNEPMTARELKIKQGKIWQVYPNGEPDCVLFEGCKSSCLRFIRTYGYKAYKMGSIRLGKVISEKIN